jgi:hypothetical protein
MNFLSKLLQAIAFIPGIVTSIEGLFSHRPGNDKKDAVMSFLQAALSAGDAVMSRDIVDQAKFKEGLSKIVDGTVECFNASVWAAPEGSQPIADSSPAPAN